MGQATSGRLRRKISRAPFVQFASGIWHIFHTHAVGGGAAAQAEREQENEKAKCESGVANGIDKRIKAKARYEANRGALRDELAR
jgi:hypothetical protein